MASDVHVLGDGVAAMMLAARADELGAQTLSIVRPDGAPAPKDHMLGFWATPASRLPQSTPVTHGRPGRSSTTMQQHRSSVNINPTT